MKGKNGLNIGVKVTIFENNKKGTRMRIPFQICIFRTLTYKVSLSRPSQCALR